VRRKGFCTTGLYDWGMPSHPAPCDCHV